MAQARPATNSRDVSPGRMTFEEFMEWCDQDTHAEWVDGEVVWMSPVSLDNDDMAHFLAALLRLYVEHNDLGYVFGEPVLMRLATRPSGREPDIIFVSEGRSSILRKNYVDGPADLAVEVLCEESKTRDRVDKFQEYERAGVREYWIIDRDNKLADFYQLDGTGHYAQVQPDEQGVYHSAVLEGLWLSVAWLWRKPLPPLLSVLREWKII